jgi:two-component system, OmpR family, response regulator MtrA
LLLCPSPCPCPRLARAWSVSDSCPNGPPRPDRARPPHSLTPIPTRRKLGSMNHTALIVEDDPRIARLVAKNLEAAGLQCLIAEDGDTALAEFKRANPSILILDLMIPGTDGLEVCCRLRRESDVPVLMLTARSSEADKVLGFEIGADDYLTKPFSTRELVARVRALLRRSGVKGEGEPIRRGELLIDPARRVVERGAHRIELTTLEFDLLVFLANRPGRVFSRDDLLHHVWGEERVVDVRSIDSLVSRLRRRVERDAARPDYIQTVWGAGYRFAEGV